MYNLVIGWRCYESVLISWCGQFAQTVFTRTSYSSIRFRVYRHFLWCCRYVKDYILWIPTSSFHSIYSRKNKKLKWISVLLFVLFFCWNYDRWVDSIGKSIIFILGFCISVGQMKERNQENSLRLLVLLLPQSHQAVLRMLVTLLRDLVKNSESNKMSLKNVSLIVAPNLVPTSALRSQNTEVSKTSFTFTFSL